MSTIWHYLFSIVAYASILSCVAFALSHLAQGIWKVVRELLLIMLFVVAYWLLESWATYLTDYYFYPAVFWDMVPYFDWGQFSFVPPPKTDPCCSIALDDQHGISLGVPLMEASFTYATMWTARLLAPCLHYLWPFLTGIAVLALDVFLDPILALSRSCATGVEECAGVGFWEWSVHDDLGTWYFCIPLFNWVAWYAAPIFLVALVLLLKWARDFVNWIQGTTPAPSIAAFVLDGVLKAILSLAFLLLFVLAPVNPGDNIVQEAIILLLLVVGTVVSIIAYRAQFVHNEAVRWTILLPQLAFYAAALLMLLFSGMVALWPLIVVGFVCITLGAWYAVSPYWKL